MHSQAPQPIEPYRVRSLKQRAPAIGLDRFWCLAVLVVPDRLNRAGLLGLALLPRALRVQPPNKGYWRVAGRAPSFYNGFGAKFGRKSTRDPVSFRRPRDPAGVPKSRGPGGAAAGFGPAAPRRRAPPPPPAGAPRRRRAPPSAGRAVGGPHGRGRHIIEDYYNIM